MPNFHRRTGLADSGAGVNRSACLRRVDDRKHLTGAACSHPISDLIHFTVLDVHFVAFQNSPMHFSPSYSAAFHETHGEVSALATGMTGVFLGNFWETFGPFLVFALPLPVNLPENKKPAQSADLCGFLEFKGEWAGQDSNL